MPSSHSKSKGAPAEEINVVLTGDDFNSNFKVSVIFKKEGSNDVALKYPEDGTTFLDSDSKSLTINIPKNDIEKLHDIGNYTLQAEVESN